MMTEQYINTDQYAMIWMNPIVFFKWEKSERTARLGLINTNLNGVLLKVYGLGLLNPVRSVC